MFHSYMWNYRMMWTSDHNPRWVKVWNRLTPSTENQTTEIVWYFGWLWRLVRPSRLSKLSYVWQMWRLHLGEDGRTICHKSDCRHLREKNKQRNIHNFGMNTCIKNEHVSLTGSIPEVFPLLPPPTSIWHFTARPGLSTSSTSASTFLARGSMSRDLNMGWPLCSLSFLGFSGECSMGDVLNIEDYRFICGHITSYDLLCGILQYIIIYIYRGIFWNLCFFEFVSPTI